MGLIRQRGRAVAGAVAVASLCLVTPPAVGARPMNHIPPSACHVTSAVVRDPLPVSPGPVARYVELSATNGRGVWGGVAFDGGHTFAVIRRAGNSVRVLQRTIMHGSWAPNVFGEDQPSVDVVGVTRSGHLIAAIQAGGRKLGVYKPFRSARGTMRQMRMLATWRSARPTSVAADGTAVGIARAAGRDLVVEWAPNGQHVRILARTRGNIYGAYLASDGEVGYSVLTRGGVTSSVLRPGRRAARLVGATGSNVQPLLSAVSGVTFYGDQTALDTGRIATWVSGNTEQSRTLAHPLGRLNFLSAVGARHSYAGWHTYPHTGRGEYFVTGGGGAARVMPRQAAPEGSAGPLPNAISGGRKIAYTGTDHNVHFLAC